MTGALGWGPRHAGRACAAAAAALALACAPACGKKAPLRLPEQRSPERASTPRASVREGRLTIQFSVPSHRIFPEREDPWVLARILRRQSPGTEFVEVGTILESRGFAFDEPLAWSEEAPTSGASAYRVEFRDATRRRRALSEPVEVPWQAPPAPPQGLTAVGDDRAVALSWGAPAGVAGTVRYRLLRREEPGGASEILTADLLEEPRHTDARVMASREYCYQVRSVIGAPALEIEGPASAEVCARTEDVTPPPPPSAVRVTATPGAFQLAWEDVQAPDLLGYRIYRAIEDGPLVLITQTPIRGNAYREQTPAAPAGARYRYVMTAVDDSARLNESPFSPPSEALAIPPADAP